jgi:BirA family biotin operon repressor/biotin-[acetyl-CoA-carboxylase] ligase
LSLYLQYQTFAETKLIGQKMLEFQVLASTNNHTAEMLRQVVIHEGCVIWAHKQTEGKGQRGNKWQTNDNANLTFSLVLYPEFVKTANQFILNQTFALALQAFLNDILSNYKVEIKWPNDILIKGKKIAGILIENFLKAGNIEATIVGIGLNVNQLEFPAFQREAVSMQLLSGLQYDTKELLRQVCVYLDKYYSLLNIAPHLVKQDYLKNLYKMGVEANFDFNGNKMKGIIRDVDVSGCLIIETENSFQKFDLKEIVFLED